MMKLTLWCPLTSDFWNKNFRCVTGLRDVLTILVSRGVGGQIQPRIGRRRAMICSCTGVCSRRRQVYQTSHYMYQLIDTLLINVLNIARLHGQHETCPVERWTILDVMYSAVLPSLHPWRPQYETMGHFWLSLSLSESLSETLESGLRPKFNLTLDLVFAQQKSKSKVT